MRYLFTEDHIRGVTMAGLLLGLTGCDASPSPARIGAACFEEKVKTDLSLNKIVMACSTVCRETFSNGQSDAASRMKESGCISALSKASDPHSICDAGAAVRGTPEYDACVGLQ